MVSAQRVFASKVDMAAITCSPTTRGRSAVRNPLADGKQAVINRPQGVGDKLCYNVALSVASAAA